MNKFLAALALMALASFLPLSNASAQGVMRICVTTNALGGCQDVSSANPLPVTGGGGGGGSVTQGTVPWVDNVSQWGGTNVLSGTGVQAAGSPRVTVSRDATTIAGAAPGTAGTASANVVTVQGIAGGTAIPVSGTFSATLGGFTPSASGAKMTQLAVTTSDSSGTLPTGAVVVVSNTGSNPMFCNVNAITATTSDQLIPGSSWFAFTIPATITTLHCIATGGSTTADGLGGSGLPTGAGGGGSSGSGSNASVGTIGATAPGSATYFGMLVAGNLVGVPGTANGVLVDSTTLATVANQPTKAAQGSTTSGETGTLGMTATTTAAPTYTTAQTNPLSTTPTGDLRAFDTTVAADIVSGQCTQPCPVKQLGDQSTYEAIGGTGNAALTNTATGLSIQTQAINLMRIECWNPNTTPVFLQLFDAATGITVGTTVPTKSIECPAGNGTSDGIYDHEYNGIKFAAGLRVVATTTRTGSTAPTTAVPASIGYALGN